MLADAAKLFFDDIVRSKIAVYILNNEYSVVFCNDYAKNLSFEIENENLERIKFISKDLSGHIPANVQFFKFNNNGEEYFFCTIKSVYEDIIKEHLILKQKALESKNMLSFLQQSSEGFCLINEEGKIVLWSEMLQDLTGIKSEDILNKRAESVYQLISQKSSVDKEKVREIFSTIYKEQSIPDEFKEITAPFINKNGERRYLQQNIFPIITERGFRLGAIIRDVTEKNIASEKLQSSLDEKVVLLREIHHRVKNNLQIITSLLTLQSDYIKDKDALVAIKESQNRIKSMALIHELLYKSNNFHEINIKEYITNLADSLFRSYKQYQFKVKLSLNIEQFQIEIDKAINCGLILNELISNSMKYAFDNDMDGVISLQFRKTSDNYCILKFSDNGKGFPKDIKIEDPDSLGLKLVNALKEQLEAELKIEQLNGIKYTFKFKLGG